MEISNENLFKIEDFDKKLSEQITLLLEWNKKNIDMKPEQVRKNIETLLRIFDSYETISTYTVECSSKEESPVRTMPIYKGFDI